MKEQNMNQVELMNGELDETMLEDVNGGFKMPEWPIGNTPSPSPCPFPVPSLTPFLRPRRWPWLITF